MSSDPDASPINALPPVVVILSLLIVLVELALEAGAMGLAGGAAGLGWRGTLVETYAFSPRLFSYMAETGRWQLWDVARIVTYPFLHFGFMHMLFALVFLLALGKMVGEIFRGWAVLSIFLGASISGALVFWLFDPNAMLLVGGYPAVYGLIGAYTFLMWVKLGADGENRAQAFTLIAALLGIQLAFSLLFGGGRDWIADVGGFAGGFLLSFLVAPGGWHRAMAKIRRR